MNEDQTQVFEKLLREQNLLLQKNVEASNRTTSAVRAFVVFLFVQLSFITVALGLSALADQSVDMARCIADGDHCQPNGFLETASGFVWVAGVIVSSFMGWSELQASELPSNRSLSNGVVKRSVGSSIATCSTCGSPVNPRGKCTSEPLHRV